MSREEGFALVLIFLTVSLGGLGWMLRRFISRTDARWAKLDQLGVQDEIEKATQPLQTQANLERMDRIEQAIAKLLEIVTQQGLQYARHEGYHEAHGMSGDDPLMGGKSSAVRSEEGG